MWWGDWGGAETELNAAIQLTSAIRPTHAAGPTRRLAELRIRQGRLDEAAALGREEAAASELRAASDSLREIGAGREAERAEQLLAELNERPDEGGRPESPLTRRECEVLRLVAEGLSDKEIATKLVISEHTVHRHVSNIRTKLRVPSRTAAAAQATKLGLI